MKARIPKNAKPINSRPSSAAQKQTANDEMMTDEEFWAKLHHVTEQKQTYETTQEFIELLIKGYEQELQILIYGVEELHGKGTVNQACYIDNGEKKMLYFTDHRHEKECTGIVPAGANYAPKCVSAYIRDVIDNAVESKDVTALVFNHGSENMYIIPKFLLALTMMKHGTIPKK